MLRAELAACCEQKSPFSLGVSPQTPLYPTHFPLFLTCVLPSLVQL